MVDQGVSKKLGGGVRKKPEDKCKCRQHTCHECFPYKDQSQHEQARAEYKRRDSVKADRLKRKAFKSKQKSIFLNSKEKVPRSCVPFVDGQKTIGECSKEERKK